MRALLIALALLAAPAAPAAADDPARAAAIVKRAIEDYIRPATARFAEDTHRLDVAVTAFCDSPGRAARAPVESGFAAAVDGWSDVQFLRFGPLIQAHRLERVAFWPDPRGTGLRQLRQALAERDASVTDPASLAGKSVALQGLPALEYLLYAGDGDPAGAAGAAGGFRCDYAVAAAASLAELAAAVATEWADADGFSRRLLQPGRDDPLYRTPTEALAELHRALATGLQVTRDRKLKPVLGEDVHAAKPFLAPFRRAGLGIEVLADDVFALMAFVHLSGFTGDLPRDFRWLGDSMAFEFANAIGAAEAVALPVDEAVYDPAARGRLQYLSVVLGNLRNLTQQELAAALGLKVGFNALDGD